LRYGIAAAMIAAVVFVVVERGDRHVLASNIGVSVYSNGVAVVQVPYRRDGGVGTVSVLINGQTVVRALPAFAEKYGNDNFFFSPPADMTDRPSVRVSFDSASGTESLVRSVSVTRPSDVSDRNESAPRIAAAAMVALTKRNAGDTALPADPETIVDELKFDMKWTVAGVSSDNYSSGLTTWARKKGLPITTDMILGSSSSLLDAMATALKRGDAVQAYLWLSRGGHPAIDRTVLVERVVVRDGEPYIGIRDVAGPTGVNVYRVHDGAIEGYAFTSDVAVIRWGFVQHWNK
jgi:hypothetical protein